MRQSCVYGPRQFGVEDQGWLAWFVIAAAVLTVIGTFFRGPGWSWVWPWIRGAQP